MEIPSIDYALLKSEFSSKALRMFYIQLYGSDGTTTVGYTIYVMSPTYGLQTTITSGSDISNFESNYKSGATSVGSVDEAQAKTFQPLLTSPILPGSQSGRSFGYVSTNATSSFTVRATTYTPPGSNAQRSIRSSSANDTSAGTGARTVKITYYDATCAGPFEETVTLNGLTWVNTTNVDIALIEKMEVTTAGSGGGNAGTITLNTGTAGGGSAIGTIAVSDNITYWAHHYVPAGKTCYILAVDGSASVTNGGLTINVVNPIDATSPQIALDTTIRHQISTIVKQYIIPISVIGPAILFLNERPVANTASVTYAGFSWFHS